MKQLLVLLLIGSLVLSGCLEEEPIDPFEDFLDECELDPCTTNFEFTLNKVEATELDFYIGTIYYELNNIPSKNNAIFATGSLYDFNSMTDFKFECEATKKGFNKSGVRQVKMTFKNEIQESLFYSNYDWMCSIKKNGEKYCYAVEETGRCLSNEKPPCDTGWVYGGNISKEEVERTNVKYILEQEILDYGIYRESKLMLCLDPQTTKINESQVAGKSASEKNGRCWIGEKTFNYIAMYEDREHCLNLVDEFSEETKKEIIEFMENREGWSDQHISRFYLEPDGCIYFDDGITKITCLEAKNNE